MDGETAIVQVVGMGTKEGHDIHNLVAKRVQEERSEMEGGGAGILKVCQRCPPSLTSQLGTITADKLVQICSYLQIQIGDHWLTIGHSFVATGCVHNCSFD